MQHRHDSLQSRAGIDVPGGQTAELARFIAVILNKHQVPQLHEPAAVAVDLTDMFGVVRFVAKRLAHVDMNLAARAARAGIAHFPEVVLAAETQHPFFGNAGALHPQGFGLRVGREAFGGIPAEDRRPQAIFIYFPDLG